jgi:hypothetical protein
MAQFRKDTQTFLDQSKTIYEVPMIATKNGEVVGATNPLPVTLSYEEPGNYYSFNNHSTNTHRGWTMDATIRPTLSVRVNPQNQLDSSLTTLSDIVKIYEYELGNNNANSSTIIYEWYNGDLTISGAAIPNWTNLGTKIQYRVYEDKYSSNSANTFSINSASLFHSGIVIGKNTSGDELPVNMIGGVSSNMITLCLKRVDTDTKLDVWFALNLKELT